MCIFYCLLPVYRGSNFFVICLLNLNHVVSYQSQLVSISPRNGYTIILGKMMLPRFRLNVQWQCQVFMYHLISSNTSLTYLLMVATVWLLIMVQVSYSDLLHIQNISSITPMAFANSSFLEAKASKGMHQVCIKITWPPFIYTSALKIPPMVVRVYTKCFDIAVFCCCFFISSVIWKKNI